MERTLKYSERGFKNLSAVASVLTAVSKNGFSYRVRDTYLDYGQGWMWTTIIDSRDVQILSPRDWKEIVQATTADELFSAIKKIMNDEYFGDK